MEKMEIIEAECPSCSPDEPVAHLVLKESEGRVRCEECGLVHVIPVKKQRFVKLKVIVSRQDKSSVQETEVDADEYLHAGDEFVVDTGEEISGVRIQSLELKTSKRVEKAKPEEVLTIWARAIDEVIVKIAVQKHEITESLDYKVNGDYEFTIGDTIKVKGYEVKISYIKIRDGALMKREGATAKAKDIKRIYSKIVSESKFGSRKGVRGGRKISGSMRSSRET
ncbi:hypothetical protein CUJ83_01180 [Methanocella sp. CWC-04]|uniref:Uncharacterized protein n=1 Tax=Methanooceanicella nereidis TaxID=2052831 RepID=A0AAP2W3X4_9EURY|nr:HVO_0476 family zinc finger protein [Methanocella sp. CWC-04]MCD1293610.1 hypothetical protein [Methanocella sp. CWC-04]